MIASAHSANGGAKGTAATQRAATKPAENRREWFGDDILGADGMRSEDDRWAQEVDPEPGVAGGLSLEQPFDLCFLLGVEQVRGRPCRPVFGHPNRVVAMEPVGGDRRGIHESPGARRGRCPECV